MAGLVGYTNAGKSTLLNSLTGASVDAEDRLFSTLDPITRQVRLPSGRELLVTDTVGFIQKLPPAIVAAFRATLEEAQESTMIVHVVDVTHPNAGTQADVVERVLADLQLAEQPRILALNKTDLLADDIGPLLRSALADAEARAHRAVSISAKTGEGMDGLLAEMDALLQGADEPDILASPATNWGVGLSGGQTVAQEPEIAPAVEVGLYLRRSQSVAASEEAGDRGVHGDAAVVVQQHGNVARRVGAYSG